MSTLTLAQAQEQFGVQVETGIELDSLIPIIDQVQFQGDVSIIPDNTVTATTPIPSAGVPVVRGENGGNTHALMGEGFFDATSNDDLTIGVLTVPANGTVYMAHPEHGYAGIAPGSYRIGRQREMADEIRRVAD